MYRSICVLGSLNMDVVVSVDRFVNPGETIEGLSVSFLPGGKGSNQAIAVANMGVSVGLIGSVGKDKFGDSLLENLIKNGVNTDFIERTSLSSGSAFVTVNSKGENQIIVVSGSNSSVSKTGFKKYVLKTKDLPKYLISQFETPMDVVYSAFSHAARIGVTTVLNPSPVRNIPKRIIDLTDIFILNEVEFSQVVGKTVSADSFDGSRLKQIAIDWQRFATGKTLILTLGDKGVIAFYKGVIIQQPAIKVENVVDTTGAGDCFCGSFIAFLDKGYDIHESLGLAQKASSLSIQSLGASPSFPLLESVLKE